MKTARLESMIGGWFIGNFDPSLHKTTEVEVAVKKYDKHDKEGRHHHKVATEYTAIVSGRVRMFGQEFGPGSIIVIEPDETTDFESLEDNTITVVVKIPSVGKDKYIG